MPKFGFIGVGNMGGALARAVVSAVGGNNVILFGVFLHLASRYHF